MIMLYGEKRVGKDEVAKILIDNGYERLAFADKPKELLCNILEIPLDIFEVNKEKLRYKLIYFTEEMKKIDKYIWVKYVYQKSHDKTVISDLRFIDEYNYFKDMNEDFIVIHIKDDNIEEKNIDKIPFDYEIDNTIKDKELLKKNVLSILEKIKNRS